MSSKKFKGKTCVYCGIENSSQTGDHIFAREFFLSHRRQNLPQVPSCMKCNNEKSKLEHYLTTVLPFGGHHEDSSTILNLHVPPRLAKNKRLHRHLSEKTKTVWTNERGILLPNMTVPIEASALENLFCFIVRGLLWHHWKVILTSEHFVGASALTREGEMFFWNFFNMNANRKISNSIGTGTFKYEGIQGFGCPQLSVWRFSIYDGLTLCGDPNSPESRPSLIWALTCRKNLKPETIFQD